MLVGNSPRLSLGELGGGIALGKISFISGSFDNDNKMALGILANF